MRKILSIVLLFSFFAPLAQAESETLTVLGKRGKIVAKSALYGAGGGLVVGLASQVFKKKAKNIFMFGSLGMYAGILLGIYIVSTTSDPKPYEGPDTYDDYGEFSSLIKPREVVFEASRKEPLKGAIQLSLVRLTF